MKKLTKIKLINWHLYADSTIDVSNNVVICGGNGSGKSTLIDAIHLLFLPEAANLILQQMKEMIVLLKVMLEGN